MSEWQGDRGNQPPRGTDRIRLALGPFTKTGGTQRSRFAQDGDVPVVIKPRKQPAAILAPINDDRAIQAEQALAKERAARVTVEEALAAAQRRIQALQTQIAHINIAHAEALRGEREARVAAETALQHATPMLPARKAKQIGAKAKIKPARGAAPRTAVAPKPIVHRATAAATIVAPTAPKAATGKAPPDKATQDRAAVLRLVLHGALDRDQACARLGLKPRSLRDLLAAAREHGADIAARSGRMPTRSTKVVTRAELQAKRNAVLPLLLAGKITRSEACARLNIKPRGLRKLLGPKDAASD